MERRQNVFFSVNSKIIQKFVVNVVDYDILLMRTDTLKVQNKRRGKKNESA